MVIVIIVISILLVLVLLYSCIKVSAISDRIAEKQWREYLEDKDAAKKER